MNKIGKNHDNIIKMKHGKTLNIEGTITYTLHENLRYYSWKLKDVLIKFEGFLLWKLNGNILPSKMKHFVLKARMRIEAYCISIDVTVQESIKYKYS